MENGVEIVSEEVRPVNTTVTAAAAADQECFYTPAAASEAAEFFFSPAYHRRALDVEAGLVADQESFYTPAHRHGAPSYPDDGFHTPMAAGNGVDHGDFKFQELKDELEAVEGENRDAELLGSEEELVHDQNPESEEIDVAVHGEREIEGPNLEGDADISEKINEGRISDGEVLVSEKIDGVVDAQVSAESRDEEAVGVEEKKEDLGEEPVGVDEKREDLDEEDGREGQVGSNDMEAIKSSDQEVVGLEEKREDLDEEDGREGQVESTDTDSVITDEEGVVENGDIMETVVAETDQGVREARNALPNGHSEMGSKSTAKTYASVIKQIKQISSEERKNTTEGEGSGSSSTHEIVEKRYRESVLVEDLCESSSMINDNNEISSQPASPSASTIGNYAGSPPASLGSSSGSILEIVEEHELGESSSMNNYNNSSSSQARMASTSTIKHSACPTTPADIGSKSGSTSEIVEEHDGVVMEKLGESNSMNNDNDKSSSQSAKPSASHIENSAGPTLRHCPAGLGPSSSLLEPSARPVQQPRVNGAVHRQPPQPPEEPANDDPEEIENDETRRKLQDIRVKFLRLAHRLGQTPHNVVVAQVLYRLGLAEQLRRNTNRVGVFSFDRASVMAEQLEAEGKDVDDFTCTILVIGKAGVGKSATINSILDEHDCSRACTDAFQSGTKTVQVIKGRVQGINVRVIDTPGLLTCSIDQQRNIKTLNSIKKLISKAPPDIVLYFDRLDMQSRDFEDVPLLRSITDIFGTSIWFNAIVVLTHAASAPPDGPNGTPLSYEMFVSQRSHVVQQAIRQAAGDVRLMNPVSLVENHSACRTNRQGQRVLPNGQVWKPQLLLLSFASKILAEANTLLRLQDNPPNTRRARIPPLPAFLSSLLQSRPQLKLPEEQYSDDDDDDADETSDSDEGADYDELPPFKPLNKAQMAKLTKEQKNAYFEELEYREKLFSKKQLKAERKHRKFMRNMAEAAEGLPNDYNGENPEDDSSGPATVPVALPDLVLPTSFDSDNPTHRYRFLETSNQWVVRPVLETQGWDHDIGYEGLNLERSFVVKDKVPISVSGQVTKDKKECTIQMELASSIKHSEAVATSLGLDVQTVGKDLAYTLRGETRVRNFRRNNTAAGVSVTLVGDSMSAGVKIEDKLVVNKRLRLLMSGGSMSGRGDVAYGGRLEATLRDKDYPIGRTLSTFALSVVDWHGDLATGCNIQSQFPFGRGTSVVGHVNLSNRGSGQVGIRLNSSEHIQIALLALFPIFKSLKRLLVDSSQPMSQFD